MKFLTTEGLHIPFEDCTTPTKVVLHFRKITSGVVYRTGRHHLEWDIYSHASIRSLLPKSERSQPNYPGIGFFYSAPLYLQRGHGIGNFFGSLFRWVHPILWSGPKQWVAKRLEPVARYLPISLNASLMTRRPPGI